MTEIVSHRHDQAPVTHAAANVAGSALGLSAGGRLLFVAPVLLVIWLGVYWALA